MLKSKESVPNPIRYNHEYQDEETGFYYLRGRYYNSAIRRFTTPDPAEDGINFYAYCGNNPIDYVDPSGYIFLQKAELYTLVRFYSGDDLVNLISEPLRLFDREGDTIFMGWLANLAKQIPVIGGLISGALSVITGITVAQQCWIKSEAEKAFKSKCGLKATIGFSTVNEGEVVLNSLEQVSKLDTLAFETGIYGADKL